ncbi:hypothetical protein CAEBREN_18693 [Caenorhabditis brenneri]|uniref:Uncharacterized protein n=1 Tax=Caenorhabditis brenneri TaxID=135651 RepID=G0MA97_CAEBE|nr:hypothetical protein CAEBREN_18693 [Caenorhabditis brenneri]
MAEPEGPPSLVKLACDALCNSAKNGTLSLHFDPEKVSPAIRECIWEHCSLMDIVTLSSAMDSTEFFSPIARRHADDISVQLEAFNEFRTLEITCVGKSMLMWYIVRADAPRGTDAKYFQLKIGEIHSPTQMKCGCGPTNYEVLNSYLPQNDVSEAVDWVSQLFQKDIEQFFVY